MSNPTEIVLAELIRDYAQELPDAKILTFVSIAEDGGYEEETRTYPQLYQHGQTLARALRALGIGRADNVGLMMSNHPEFVETMVATSIIDAAFVPVDPRTRGAKLQYMLDFTECKGVICADYCVESILAVAADCAQLQWLIVVDSGLPLTAGQSAQLATHRYVDMLKTPGPDLPLGEFSLDDPMFLMFTSGTTGNPKAVINSHRKYMMMTQSPKVFGLTRADKYYTGLSLTHINAQGTLAGALGQAIPAVISRKFTKSRLWDICRRYGCTSLNLLGGMIPELYAVPEKPDDANNPVRHIQSSGMPPHIWQAFEKRFGVVLSEGYGATEGGAMRNPPGEGPVGSIGKPSFGWVAEILDENGNIAPPHVAGEICFRREDGSPIVVHYYKNPGASSDKVRDGWLHMGDIAHKDENGWFYFHHRVGGGVRRNGDFVNTTLVESVLMNSPLVADVFVYGVATGKNVAGEKTLVAAIVPADKVSFNEAALLTYCRAHLEKNDLPEIIQVLDEIPKTISEKPIEKACIELLTFRE
ncbi:MAG: AMP-binding protein [Spongiibacteraceae bacterium]